MHASVGAQASCDGRRGQDPAPHRTDHQGRPGQLEGHGAIARLVMLPNEAHGYRARESNMQVIAETIIWLDKYVKNRVAP